LDEKVEKSLQFIQQQLEVYKPNEVATVNSFGKDSILMQWLINQVNPDLKVLWVIPPFLPNETLIFAEAVIKKWNLNIIRIRSNKLKDKQFMENIVYKPKLWKTNPENCCVTFKDEPMFKKVRELKLKAWFSGLRATESEKRSMFTREWKQGNFVKLHPILDWTEADIWRVTAVHKLPVHSWYGLGYRCFSEDTKILTKDGLLGINELTVSNDVATLNKNGYLEYHKPKKIFRYNYNGNLIHIKNRSIDLKITPNHEVYYRRRFSALYSKINKNKREKAKKTVKKAKELRKNGLTYAKIGNLLGVHGVTISRWLHEKTKPYYKKSNPNFDLMPISYLMKKLKTESIEMKANCNWVGTSPSHIFVIPKQFIIRNRGIHTFPVIPFLKFMGWYLSEGWTCGKSIHIGQKKQQNLERIKNVLMELGVYISQDKDGVYFTNSALARYLKQFGHAKDKYIPQWIKKLSPKYLRYIFDTLMLGDGHYRNNCPRKYTTTSQKLMNDMLEIALKLGFPVSIGKYKNVYNVYFKRKRFGTPRLSHNPKITKYNGRIWDVEVPNHIIMVERNGTLCWTGNSLGCENCSFPNVWYAERGGRWKDTLMESLGCGLHCLPPYLSEEKQLLEIKKMHGTKQN